MSQAALGAIALCLVSAAAFAQSATIKLTAEDTHTIKEIVLKDSSFPRTASADYKVGDEAPASVSLQTFPQVVVEKISATKSHRFFLSGDKVVVVDTRNRIADVIE